MKGSTVKRCVCSEPRVGFHSPLWSLFFSPLIWEGNGRHSRRKEQCEQPSGCRLAEPDWQALGATVPLHPLPEGPRGQYILTKLLVKGTEWPVCSSWRGGILSALTTCQPGHTQMSSCSRRAPLSELHPSPPQGAGTRPPAPPLGGVGARGRSWGLSAPPPASDAGSSVGRVV